MKHVKNCKNYDVGPISFTLDDLERLKVKVTNGPACGDIRQSGKLATGVLVNTVSESNVVLMYDKPFSHLIIIYRYLQIFAAICS